MATPSCDPSKLKIISEVEGNGEYFDDIKNIIGNTADIQYVSVPEISFKCLDGRHRKPIIGAPGGDAGLFLNALNVYEDLSLNSQLSQESVDSFFSSYLSYMKQDKFYMCTDDSAISHLENELGVIIKNKLSRLRA
jgi:hypothetical protein